MTWMIVAAGIVVTSSAPPLSPDEALRVFQSSTTEFDRLHVVSERGPDLPRVPLVLASTPGDGPFGPFPSYHVVPLNCCRSYTTRLPHDHTGRTRVVHGGDPDADRAAPGRRRPR